MSESNQKEIDKFLTSVYYKLRSPASFTGVFKLWNYVKSQADKPSGLNFYSVKNWLKKQDTHQLHVRPPKIFPREHIIVENIDDLWDGDILDMSQLSKYNSGVKYLLVFIDLFSRFLWVKQLKNKTGQATTKAFTEIINKGRKCASLRHDQGREFLNSTFQRCLLENNISHIVALGEHKASYAERVNRTIEDRLYRFFYENQTFKYTDAIEDLVYSYNHTKHSTIGMPPADVTEENSYDLYKQVYLPILNKRAEEKVVFSFAPGDLVRLSAFRGAFARGYHIKWTEEIFEIFRRIPSHPPRYRVKDLNGEAVLGSFYEQELLKVNAKSSAEISFKIEKVLATKKVKGVKYSLIKWLGYSDTFNTFIPTKNISNYAGKK